MHRIASFDVFDTCLIRTRAFPSDVFYDIAMELKQAARLCFGNTFAEDFRAARFNAEVAAFKSLDTSEEVTLDEIWRQLAATMGMPDWREGVRSELRIEALHMRANSKMGRVVNAERSRGRRIAFTSDTSLPSGFIMDRLKDHGFYEQGDVLLVSSEVGLTKRTGSLFRRLADSEGVKFGDILHTGDNVHSDIAVPRRLGIAVRRCRDAELQGPEIAILTGAPEDTAFPSRLAGAMRSCRLGGQGADAEGGLRDFVASFLGPVLTTFAAWLLGQAARDGVSRLYFLSRDCYLLRQVAGTLATGSGIECRYLQISRQALLLPSAKAVSAAGMPWMRLPFEQPTLDRLLAKLGVDGSDRSELASMVSRSIGGRRILNDEADWRAFWRIVGEEPVRAKVASRIAERKQHAIRYFDSQGLFDGARWAVVDLGWLLSCQTALKTLIQAASPNKTIQGYYLGLAYGRRTTAEAGNATALFFANPPDHPLGTGQPHVFSRVTALEHLFGVAPHGTVRSYESNGNGESSPVCAELTGAVKSLSSAIENLLAEFVLHHWEACQSSPTTAAARVIIDQLLWTCLTQPKRQWCEALTPIMVSEDQNNIGAVPIAAPLTWRRAITNRLPGRIRARYGPREPMHWPEANQCLTDGALGSAIKATRAFRLAKRVIAGHASEA